MASSEIKQLIKDSVDVETLLISLGFNITRITSNEIRATCKIHGGDNPTAFSIRLDSKKWKCFTKKCEQGFNGKTNNDLVALVMLANNFLFMDALQYLADFSGIDLKDDDPQNKDDYRYQQDSRKYIRSVERLTSINMPLPTISEDRVIKYISNRDDYFINQGFLPATLETFEVGAKYDGYGILRATVPIRDADGNLVSVSARREDCDEDPRYLLDYEFKKGRVLYNLHRARTTGCDTVIIVEGFKALWAVYEAGYQNVVACMGADITEDQVLSLCSSGFINCVLMFDGDSAGRSGMLKGLPKVERAFSVSAAYLPEGDSPDSFTRQELSNFLELYVNIF